MNQQACGEPWNPLIVAGSINEQFEKFRAYMEMQRAAELAREEELISLRYFIVASNKGDPSYAFYRWTEAGMPEYLASGLTLEEARQLRIGKVAAELLAGIKAKAPQPHYAQDYWKGQPIQPSPAWISQPYVGDPIPVDTTDWTSTSPGQWAGDGPPSDAMKIYSTYGLNRQAGSEPIG